MDFPGATKEWIALKVQLSNARKDLKVLNSREKELRAAIGTHMKENDIAKAQVGDTISVNQKTKTTKGSMTKEVVKAGIKAYFHGDEVATEACFAKIVAILPLKEVTSITLTGV